MQTSRGNAQSAADGALDRACVSAPSSYFRLIQSGSAKPVSELRQSFTSDPPSVPATTPKSVALPRVSTSDPCRRVHRTATPAVRVTSPSVPSRTKPPSFDVIALVTANCE